MAKTQTGYQKKASDGVLAFAAELDSRGMPRRLARLVTTPDCAQDFKSLSVFCACQPSWRKWCAWRAGGAEYQIGAAMGIPVFVAPPAELALAREFRSGF